ncbi:MAG: DUF1338 domain-containing protein [Flavobacteriaceae bacterium]
MHLSNNSAISKILQGVFAVYRDRVPDVQKITDAMVSHGIVAGQSEILNDHIAFRTMGVKNLGIASFEKIFLAHGYEKRDYFFFEGKKLDAYWYAPPDDELPRVFISELRVKDLSEKTQQIIEKYTGTITADPVDSIDLNNVEEVTEFFHKPLWQLPTLEDYKALLEESEYAAWVIYNRYYLNHYTISVHQLDGEHRTLEQFNEFLKSIGITLNNSGGEIKVSPDGLLRQSSSVAEKVETEFAGGEKAIISGSYVEFAERLPLPQFAHLAFAEIKRHMRRDGFESGNADKIFESTFTTQTSRT